MWRGRGGGRRLLIWDAPNMDMCLSEVIGAKATADTRPNMAAVLAWLCAKGGPEDTIEACVFANIPPGLEGGMASWIATLRHTGFAVFVKPKLNKRDDIDTEMVRHIERRLAHGRVAEVIVASHDAKAFSAPLRRIAGTGVPVTVLGYRERDSYASSNGEIGFVDLESIDGVFPAPLARTNLYDLPISGRWFDPFVVPEPTGAPAEPEPVAESIAPPAPSRQEVLDVVAAEVAAACEDGEDGLPVQEIGDILRDEWPAFDLQTLGFETRADLLNALTSAHRLVVARRADKLWVLPAGTIDTTTPGGPETAGALGAEGDEPRPGEEPPTEATEPTVDLRADEPGSDQPLRASRTDDTDAARHPFYRVFTTRPGTSP